MSDNTVKVKRILILSLKAGQGHNSAARAVQDELRKSGAYCHVLDVYAYLNKVVGTAYDKGYTLMARKYPRLLDQVYQNAERVHERDSMKSYFPYAFADMNKRKMSRYISEFQPDAIVCTHVIGCITLHQLLASSLLDPAIPRIGIITDYTLYEFWDKVDINYYIVGADFMINEFQRRGIPREKVKPFGIPLASKFEKSISKDEAREKLGLEKKPTLLVLSGGMGMGTLPDAVRSLESLDCWQVVVICGSNENLLRKLEKKYPEGESNFKLLGFVDNMDEYMDAADIVFTKPGGLTTTEALRKDKTLLLMQPLPGVEEANTAYYVNSRLALLTNKYFNAASAIEMLDAETLQCMSDARRQHVKKESAKNTADFVLSLI